MAGSLDIGIKAPEKIFAHIACLLHNYFYSATLTRECRRKE